MTGGKTLILFFDEGKLRKCIQKDDKEVEIHQSTSAPIQLKDFEFRIDQGNNVCYA